MAVKRCRKCNNRIWPWQSYAGSEDIRVGWAHLTNACFANPKGDQWAVKPDPKLVDHLEGNKFEMWLLRRRMK